MNDILNLSKKKQTEVLTMKIQKLFGDFDMPLSIKTIEMEDFYCFWNENIKIFYILRGEIEINSSKKSSNLKNNEFFILNPYYNIEIYNKTINPSIILEISIKQIYLSKIFKNFSEMTFSINLIDKNNETQQNFKQLLADLTRLSINQENLNNNYKIYLKTLILCDFIISNFRTVDNYSPQKIKHKKYLIEIIEYLEKNYSNENITTSEIADYVSLTPQYTLKFFKKNFGIGLIDFLNTLRIKKSIGDLIHSNKSIIEISIDYGFNNSKTYHRLFKKIYKISPGEYKKKYSSTNKINIKENTHYDTLKQFCTCFSSTNDEIIKKNIEMNSVDLKNTSKAKTNNYWKKILALGKASEGLKGEVQNQIKELISEIDFEYIKINSIFSNELYIYSEDENGKSYYNFAYIDKLLDFFINSKLKPFINIGYMPSQLKSNDYSIHSSNVSYPKDIKKWNELIINLFTHFKEKYGNIVYEWKFEIWNNPDHYKHYWYESNDEFYYFFHQTYNAIKKVSPKFKIGGPSISSLDGDLDFLKKFIRYIKNNSIKISFFSFNLYNMKHNKDTKFRDYNEWEFQFYEYDIIKNLIKETSKKIKNEYQEEIEIVVSEWNSSAYPKDLTHDTRYMSTFIIDTVLNNFNTVESLVYWTSVETRISSEIFYGGLGLFTVNGIKKPSYNAFLLLNQLGKNILGRGKNYIVTSSDKNSYQILIYNFVYFNKKYLEGDFKTISDTNRKNAFENFSSLENTLTLNNITDGNFSVKKYTLNEENGSSYDAWINMGAPKNITNEIFQYLKSKEKMKLEFFNIKIETSLTLKDTLNAQDIVMYKLERQL